MPRAFAASDRATDVDVDTRVQLSEASGVYAQVAALLHESRREAPDQLGSFLARRVVPFGMRDLSVYMTDFEQRRLVPITGSAATSSIDMDDSTGGRSFTTARQVDEAVDGGTRLWSVVIDGAARLGVMAVTLSEVDDRRLVSAAPPQRPPPAGEVNRWLEAQTT